MNRDGKKINIYIYNNNNNNLKWHYSGQQAKHPELILFWRQQAWQREPSVALGSPERWTLISASMVPRLDVTEVAVGNPMETVHSTESLCFQRVDWSYQLHLAGQRLAAFRAWAEQRCCRDSLLTCNLSAVLIGQPNFLSIPSAHRLLEYRTDRG